MITVLRKSAICVELALAIASAGQTRYELLGLIAAGEYPLHFLYHTASKLVVSFCQSYTVLMPYWVMQLLRGFSSK